MTSKNKKIIPLPQLGNRAFAFDSHCHLDMTDYDDYREVVTRADAAGVKFIFSVGIDLPSSRAALDLANEFPGVYSSVGIHPHHVADAKESDYQQIAELALHPKVKAYGEIGLDYVRNYAPRDVQIRHFRRQVELAKELELPLIIHDREAHGDVMEILVGAGPFPKGGVMHCYSGDMELAKEVIGLGFYLSITGVVTFAKSDMLQEVARLIPLDTLLVETDGPYLSPVPY
ncbi:MAG: TatD family hydrolase, partial [Proteobacteria bacterium]|nr:TatD family hydrolase [Pseudomonadota bacterium]